jgi:hypothetical protein
MGSGLDASEQYQRWWTLSLDRKAEACARTCFHGKVTAPIGSSQWPLESMVFWFMWLFVRSRDGRSIIASEQGHACYFVKEMQRYELRAGRRQQRTFFTTRMRLLAEMAMNRLL